MVVVLPQPFEPRKPKISPALDVEAHVIDRGEVAEPAGQVASDDHRLVRRVLPRGGIVQRAMARLELGAAAAR